ncbi:hypothetical protein [Desulfosarcina ovata]
MKSCEKIASIQKAQNTMRSPPYACSDSSDTFDGLHELSFVVASGKIG